MKTGAWVVWIAGLLMATGAWGLPPAVIPDCPPESGVALQVLGSGGPVADDNRASSGYLVLVDRKARVLIDTGSGSFLRFGEARAKFEDLDLIALSHFHTDHAADLPAILKSGYFSGRTRALRVSGPAAGGPFPGLEAFLQGLLEADTGPFRYLTGYLDGTGGLAKIDAREIGHKAVDPVVVLELPGLSVTALGVPHGIVPAVAYRVDTEERSLVFGTDQTGESSAFPEFAKDADLLVAHLAIPETAGQGARSLHATPSAVGEMAHRAHAGKLVLSHFMKRSLENLDENVANIRARYDGDIVLARDLQCLIP